MTIPTLAREDLTRLRLSHPLVLCLTNLVASDWTANLLLAAGASPILSSAPQEAQELAQQAQALLINIGTIHTQQLETMLLAETTAHQLGRPVVLDPVGVGASRYRKDCVLQLLDNGIPTIIRANASEIATLYSLLNDSQPSASTGRGVDSTIPAEAVAEQAQSLAAQLKNIVVVSGATDYITDGSRTETVTQGSPVMTQVTAMGCAESALIAAMSAVQPDPFRAALSTMQIMGCVGEKTAQHAQGCGSFRTAFLNMLQSSL